MSFLFLLNLIIIKSAFVKCCCSIKYAVGGITSLLILFSSSALFMHATSSSSLHNAACIFFIVVTSLSFLCILFLFFATVCYLHFALFSLIVKQIKRMLIYLCCARLLTAYVSCVFATPTSRTSQNKQNTYSFAKSPSTRTIISPT